MKAQKHEVNFGNYTAALTVVHPFWWWRKTKVEYDLKKCPDRVARELFSEMVKIVREKLRKKEWDLHIHFGG